MTVQARAAVLAQCADVAGELGRYNVLECRRKEKTIQPRKARKQSSLCVRIFLARVTVKLPLRARCYDVKKTGGAQINPCARWRLQANKNTCITHRHLVPWCYSSPLAARWPPSSSGLQGTARQHCFLGILCRDFWAGTWTNPLVSTIRHCQSRRTRARAPVDQVDAGGPAQEPQSIR